MATKEEKAIKLAESTELKQLKSAGTAEITALKTELKAQGLKTSEINKIITAEKKANTAEYNTAKATLAPTGQQTIVKTTTDANGNTVKLPILSQASPAYAGTPTAAAVSSTLQNAYNAYNTYGFQPQTVIAGNGSYSGVSLNDMTKLVLNTNNGVISQGTGDTAVPSSVYKLAVNSQTNLGKTFTQDQLGKLKEVGTDANGNKLFTSTVAKTDERTGAGVYQQQADGTYKNIGYSMTTVPPIDEGFWGSDLGKIVKIGGTIAAAYFGQPYLASQLGATAGATTAATIGANAAAGAIIATGANLATGGDLSLKSTLIGAAGGAVAGAFQAAAGITELQAASYDYTNLLGQGLTPAQAMETIAQSGYSANVVNGIAQASSTGATTFSAVADTAAKYVDATNAAVAANQPGFFENIQNKATDIYNQVTGGTTTTPTTAYKNAIFDDGSVLVTDASGKVIGNIDAAGKVSGGLTAQVFDDGTRVLLDSAGNIVGGYDTSGQFFNGTNAVSTAGTTDVITGGANSYAGSNAPLGGTPNTNFGGNLANVKDVNSLFDEAAKMAAGGAITFNDALKGLLNPSTLKGLLGGIAGNSVAKQVKGDYDANAAAVLAAGERAADMSQFKPVALTTRFGSTTTPQYDAEGRLIGYGYNAASDIAAQRDKLLTLSGQALPTTTNIEQATKDYYNQLQALQNPQREQDLAKIRSNLFATGRTGLGVGATTGVDGVALAATNPELAAYYNALAQKQAEQALTAQDIAQQRLTNQIATSGTLFGQAKDLETAAQQPMQLGMTYGAQTQGGAQSAAQTIYDATLRAEQAKLTGNMALNQAQAAGLAGGVNAAGGLLSAGANLATDYLKSLI